MKGFTIHIKRNRFHQCENQLLIIFRTKGNRFLKDETQSLLHLFLGTAHQSKGKRRKKRITKDCRRIVDGYRQKDNVQAATHCATRLRLVLRDESKVDQAGLDARDEVKGLSPQRVNTRSFWFRNSQWSLQRIHQNGWHRRHEQRGSQNSRLAKLNPIQIRRQDAFRYLRTDHPGHRSLWFDDGIEQRIHGTDVVRCRKIVIEAYPAIEGLQRWSTHSPTRRIVFCLSWSVSAQTEIRR